MIVVYMCDVRRAGLKTWLWYICVCACMTHVVWGWVCTLRPHTCCCSSSTRKLNKTRPRMCVPVCVLHVLLCASCDHVWFARCVMLCCTYVFHTLCYIVHPCVSCCVVCIMCVSRVVLCCVAPVCFMLCCIHLTMLFICRCVCLCQICASVH